MTANAQGRPIPGRPHHPSNSLANRTGTADKFRSSLPSVVRKNGVVLAAMKRARAEAQHNRRLVLGHRDLADLLVTVFGYDRPEQWNGYIPPKFYDDGYVWRPNPAGCRPFLLGLVAEATARGTS